MIPKEFISQLQSIEDIEERNKKFHSLNDKEKRREIAYDLLLLTINGKVKNTNQKQFFHRYWSANLLGVKAKDSKNFQKKLNSELPSCAVCARGGMMLAQ